MPLTKDKKVIVLPRESLSHSSVSLFRRSRQKWADRYIYGKKDPDNKYITFGKAFAEGLQAEKSENPHVMGLLPLVAKYPQREVRLEAVLEFEGFSIKLLGFADGVKEEILGEFKTGKLWTQKMADDNEQISFYNLIKYLRERKLYKDNILHWIGTQDMGHEMTPTGVYEEFHTTRTVVQILKFKIDLIKTIKEMSKFYQQELSKL